MTKAVYETTITYQNKDFLFRYNVGHTNIEITEEEEERVFDEIRVHLFNSDSQEKVNQWSVNGNGYLRANLTRLARLDLLDRTTGLSPNLQALLGSMITSALPIYIEREEQFHRQRQYDVIG